MAAQDGASSRSPQSHYFARLFSRWRSEALSVITSSRQDSTENKHLASGSSSSSFSLPTVDQQQTPQTSRRIRWKMDLTKPKSKRSLETGVMQPVVWMAEKPDRGHGDVYSSASSPPPSPSIAGAAAAHDSSQQSTSFAYGVDEPVPVRQPLTIRPQQQQQQLRSPLAETGAGGSSLHMDSSCLETQAPSSSSVDATSTSGRTSGTSALHGLMEVRLPKFPLKKLRQKQQSFTDQAVWKPADRCCWRNASGVCVRLRGARLERLAAVERQTLQKLALAHLQKANLGCAILKPKDSLPVRQKRHKYIKRKAHTVNVVEKKEGVSASSSGTLSAGTPTSRKSPTPHGGGQQVFGVPLSQCIENEQQWEWAQHESGVVPVSVALSSSPSSSNVTGSAGAPVPAQYPAHRYCQRLHRTHQHPLPSTTSSSSSGIDTTGTSSAAQQPVNRHLQQLTADEQKQRCQSLDLDEVEFLNVARASPQRLSAESSKSSLSDQASSDSLVMQPGYNKGSLSNQTSADNTPSSDRRYASSDSLLGSPSYFQYSPRYGSPTYSLPKQDSCEPHFPRVPRVVQVCTEYLSQRGLQTIGIFRVAGSAKRCRQLRLELDSGQEVVLNEEQPDIYPHDIATVLKEYFRDLPDPLLTKELYPPFIATARFPEETRVELLRYLVSLLPLANCDSLLVLLQFLRRVAKHSYDTINDQGISIMGNKMNAHNLATVFGPTILRQASGKLSQSFIENDAVIRVMESMIERCDDIFMIPSTVQDSLYRSLSETDPDALDLILTRLASEADRPSEEQEELQTAVYFSSQEELDPPSVLKESDGSTVVRTRQKTTHRIVYKIHRPTGRILGSSRADEATSITPPTSSSTGDFPSKVAALVNERFPELTLCAEQDEPNGAETGAVGQASASASSVDETIESSGTSPAAGLVGSPSTSRGLALSTFTKPPTRKLTPLAKLSEAIRQSSPKK